MKINPSQLKQMIAEAAYYRAERRNFESGYEMQDWLEAEQAVTTSLKSASRLITTHRPIEVPETTTERKITVKKPGTAKATVKRVTVASSAADSSAQ